MKDLASSESSKRPAVSKGFLIVVLLTAVLLFAGIFGSIFLTEFLGQTAASKISAPGVISGKKPSMPGMGDPPAPEDNTTEPSPSGDPSSSDQLPEANSPSSGD
jgi:hypothetical protein